MKRETPHRSPLDALLQNNQLWAEKKLQEDPEVFLRMAKRQTPKYMWLGCSDSRVPPNELLGLGPGEIFIHRNVANLFPHTDLNCLSVLQFAVEYLQVEHVIVCGHYGCGGVEAAMGNIQCGLVDHWLLQVRDIYFKEKERLYQIEDPVLRSKKLVEFNIYAQVSNICHTAIVQDAWAQKKNLTIHGWVYNMEEGLFKDLHCSISSVNQLDELYLVSKK